MPKDFLPSKDSELVVWSLNFFTKINATPTDFGLTAAQATAYDALHEDFSAALAIASDPATRTRGTVSGKNAARTPLKEMARELGRIVNAFPTITNQQRIDLGLTPSDRGDLFINPPTVAPVLTVVAAIGRQLRIRLSQEDSTSRSKPEGVDGATIFTFVGSAPPADISAWKFEGSTTRTLFDVEFGPSVAAGSQVWLCAFWFSPRSQSGPACQPVSAYVAGGVGGALAA